MVNHVLFALRTRAGLTQQDLADRTHISQSTIAMLEVGTRLPSRGMAARLEAALGDTEHSLTTALPPTRKNTPRARPVTP